MRLSSVNSSYDDSDERNDLKMEDGKHRWLMDERMVGWLP